MEIGGLPPAFLIGGGIYLISLQNLEFLARIFGVVLIGLGIWLQVEYLKTRKQPSI